MTTIKCIITTLMLLLLSTRSSAEYVSMKVNAKDSNAYLGCMIGVVPMGGSSRFALYQKFFSKDVIPENLCEGLWETPFEFSDSEADGTTSNLIDHEIIYFFKLARHFVKLEQLQITPNIPNNDDTKKTCEIIDLVKSEITKGEISFSNYKRHSDNPSSNLTELFDWQNMSKMRARIEQLLSDPIESLDLLGELFSEVCTLCAPMRPWRQCYPVGNKKLAFRAQCFYATSRALSIFSLPWTRALLSTTKPMFEVAMEGIATGFKLI